MDPYHIIEIKGYSGGAVPGAAAYLALLGVQKFLPPLFEPAYLSARSSPPGPPRPRLLAAVGGVQYSRGAGMWWIGGCKTEEEEEEGGVAPRGVVGLPAGDGMCHEVIDELMSSR